MQSVKNQVGARAGGVIRRKSGLQGLPALASPPQITSIARQRKPGRAHDVRCMVTPFGLPQVETLRLATEILTTGIALGALWFSRELLTEQDNVSQSEGGKSCPTCHGTGFVPCFCTRWSDGDVGCSACNMSGFAACKSCGGGGTAVPVPVAIRKH